MGNLKRRSSLIFKPKASYEKLREVNDKCSSINFISKRKEEERINDLLFPGHNSGRSSNTSPTTTTSSSSSCFNKDSRIRCKMFDEIFVDDDEKLNKLKFYEISKFNLSFDEGDYVNPKHQPGDIRNYNYSKFKRRKTLLKNWLTNLF